MAETLTEDILSWGGIANARFAQVCDLPEIVEDPEAVVGFLRSMNEDVAPFIGTLKMVMIGEDIRIVDESAAEIYSGRLAVQGKFSGAYMYGDNFEGRRLGYCLQLPEITVMNDDAPHDLQERAVVAIGSIETTNIFAFNDVFRGGVGLDPIPGGRDQFPRIAYAQQQLERMERVVDSISADKSELDLGALREMGRLFTEHDVIRDGLELMHFVRRANERLGIPGRQVVITTSQIYSHNPLTHKLRRVLNQDAEVRVVIQYDLRFAVVTDNDNNVRMASLIGYQTDETGIAANVVVVDVEDISDIVIKEPPSGVQ